jgi:hypothetical protein
MDHCHKVFSLIISLLCISFVSARNENHHPINGFTQSDLESWDKTYKNWKQDGLPGSIPIMNCSQIDLHDPIHDQTKTRMKWQTTACERTMLRGLCGSLGRENDVIPHSHLCDGNIREYGNYRFV